MQRNNIRLSSAVVCTAGCQADQIKFSTDQTLHPLLRGLSTVGGSYAVRFQLVMTLLIKS